MVFFYFVSAAHLHPSMIAAEQPPTTIYSTGPYQTTVCVYYFLKWKIVPLKGLQ